jgi:hypothetical protein
MDMKNLDDVMPEASFSNRFSKIEKKTVASSIHELKKNRDKDVVGISLFVWDEMVDRGIAKDPFKIAPVINNGFIGIYDFVAKELGSDPVKDVLAVAYFNENDSILSFADTTIAQCFPNDLHIADIELADNSKKALRQNPSKGYRNYPGLHLLDEYLDRLTQVGKGRGVDRLSLMIGDKDVYPVFKRHGFVVSTTQMAQMAFRAAGQGFPMIRKI